MVIGAIDALPMFLKKMDKANCWSAFLQYVVVTFIIFNTTLPQLTVSDFVAGPLISFMMALPMVVMIAKSEKKAVPVILVNAVVLGLIIAVIKHYSIHLFL